VPHISRVPTSAFGWQMWDSDCFIRERFFGDAVPHSCRALRITVEAWAFRPKIEPHQKRLQPRPPIDPNQIRSREPTNDICSALHRRDGAHTHPSRGATTESTFKSSKTTAFYLALRDEKRPVETLYVPMALLYELSSFNHAPRSPSSYPATLD
jgi:hypothetical protein